MKPQPFIKRFLHWIYFICIDQELLLGERILFATTNNQHILNENNATMERKKIKMWFEEIYIWI